MKITNSVSFPSTLLLTLFGMLVLLSFSFCAKDNTIVPATDEAQKYLGTWNVSDNAARLNYTVTIERNPENINSELFLNNFADLKGKVKGSIIGNTIVIEKQAAGSANYSVEGSGNFINSTRLEFTYSLDDNIETEMRKAVFTK